MVARTTTKPQANTSNTFAPSVSHRTRVFGVVTLSAVVVILVLIGATQLFQSHIPPRVTIDGIQVGGLSIAAAQQAVSSHPITDFHPLITVTKTYSPTTAELAISSNPSRVFDTISATLNNSPVGAWKWWATALFQPTSFISPYTANTEQLDQLLATMAKQEEIPGQDGRVVLKTSGVLKSLEVDAGKDGYALNAAQAALIVEEGLHNRQTQINLPLQLSKKALDPGQIDELKRRAEALVSKNFSFYTPDRSVELQLTDQKLVELLGIPSGIDQEKLQQLTSDWSKKIDRDPQDAKLSIEPETGRVTEFVPPLDGLVLDQPQLQTSIAGILTQLTTPAAETSNQAKVNTDSSLELPLAIKSPDKPLSQTNSLGINEKIGHGQSRYAHSIATRIHNVSLATSKVTDFIVKPGEEFSFNQRLGEVSAATGFKPAYIIKSGKTELGDGGGVCQVSTTLFRAALDAGLPITKRRPHSYRVSYYELDTKPGIDATVYAGDVDLRFINDTPNHILIHGEANPQTLAMFYDIYGTSDGRVATITDHITWGASPAAPTEYIPDPSLPPGAKKQIDWSAPGLKAKFTYTVKTASGEVKESQVFTSNYHPWSAKYLVGPTN